MADIMVGFIIVCDTIFHFLRQQAVYVTIVFVPVLLLSLLIRKRYPLMLYGLWALVLLRFVLPLDISFTYSARNGLDQLLVYFEDSAGVLSSLKYNILTDAANQQMTIQSGQNATGDIALVQENRTSFSWRIYFIICWFIGGVLFGGILFWQLVRIKRLVRRASTIQDAQLQLLIENWRRQFRIRRSIRLVCSDAFLSPFTMGVFRPVIFLPTQLIQNGQLSVLNAVIAHEAAHIKRFDAMWIKLQNLVHIIFFFHPVSWYAIRQMGYARERICDRMVLSKNVISAREYGKSMLQILQLNLFGGVTPEWTAGFGKQQKQLFQRINDIKRGKTMHTRKSVFVTTFLLVMLGCFLLPMANLSPTLNKLHAAEAADEPEIKWVLPIHQGYISSDFGDRIHPVTKKKQFHRGVDVAAPKGIAVFAAADGKVIFSDRKEKYGLLVELMHPDGYLTRYSAMDTLLVQNGQIVKAGEMIGKVGSTGLSTAPHLHFEVLNNDKAINPASLIDFSAFKKDRVNHQ